MRREVGGGNGTALLEDQIAEMFHVDLSEVAGGG